MKVQTRPAPPYRHFTCSVLTHEAVDESTARWAEGRQPARRSVGRAAYLPGADLLLGLELAARGEGRML